MNTTDLPRQPCPACLEMLECATGDDCVVPRPGCFTICFRCGMIMRFGEGLTLRLLVGEDVPDFEALTFKEKAILVRAQMEIRSRERPN